MRLEIGYNADFEVREEVYASTTRCDFSVLYLSDLHLTGWSGDTITKLEETIARLNPRVILLGGDYVESSKGLRHFARLLEFIGGREHVFAIAGNHDNFFGIERIRQLVESKNVGWLAGESVQILINGCRVQLTGNAARGRAEDVDFSMLCLHQPIAITGPNTCHDLAFAGHLHGGQFVFWRSARGLFPGRLFYRWNILKATIGKCLYLVSKGLGDTLPIRYNCKKDVLFVTVQAAHHSHIQSAL